MRKFPIVVTAMLLTSLGAFAQEGPAGDPGPRVMMFQSSVAAPVGTLATGNMFFSAELPGNGKPMAGAPYTATATTETTQTLGDGNRIVNKSSTSLARDSQGRTRREETMGMVGPWQVNGPKLVFINDPVAQANYVLDEGRQTATVLKLSGATAVGAMSAMPPPPPPPAFSGAIAQPGMNVTYMARRTGKEPEDVKTESLGVQSMEGVVVEGKRVTRTTPAGQIGNVQPIESVSEVWFSPDLQVVVRSKHTDPRFGETVYQLIGIQRAEPDRSLFEIPSSYTVKNLPVRMGPGSRMIAGEAFQIGVGETTITPSTGGK